MNGIHLDPHRRHDFVLLFDVSDGNPNGDPDAGNMPRVDPETRQGLVSDVALKRKVRDYVDLARGNEERFKIYVQSGEALNTRHQRAYDAEGIKSKGSKQPPAEIETARAWMCKNFYDIRMFGAVMTTGVNCGQVRGPVQMTFARSIDPILPLDLSITRVAVTKPEDLVTHDDDGKASGKVSEMGRKALVPYGLYRAHGFFTPSFAEKTGASEEDLDLFWRALMMMWDQDHSSSRGLMAARGLFVFSHDDPLGRAPAASLFDRVKVTALSADEPARSFGEYKVDIDEAGLPGEVHLTRLVG